MAEDAAGETGQPAERAWRCDDRLRHSLHRPGPHDAGAADRGYGGDRPGRSADRAVRQNVRPRPDFRGGDRAVPRGPRLRAAHEGAFTAPRGESDLRYRGRRSAAVGPSLPQCREQPGGSGDSRGGERPPRHAPRARRYLAPGSARHGVRRSALSGIGRRCLAGGTRCPHLRRQINRRERGNRIRRACRRQLDQDWPHRGAYQRRWHSVGPLYAASAGALRAGMEDFGRQRRPGTDQGQYRPGGDHRRGAQGVSSDPARFRRGRGRDARPADRADAARRQRPAARLGARRRSCLHARCRVGPALRAAPCRAKMDGVARLGRGGAGDRRLVVRLCRIQLVDRPGFPFSGRALGLSLVLDGNVCAHRGRAQTGAPCFRPLSGACGDRAACRTSRAADARRRAARDDADVQRHPQLYDDCGGARCAWPDEFSQSLSDADDRCDHVERGTVDKYMADGIMAFWNAPLDDPAHAEHACRAALAMRSQLARLNDGWRAEAAAEARPFREVRAGIGLNTGQCVVGNLCSDQRFDYSVLGDDANVASRLEGQTKTYLVDIIVGERTAEQAPQFALLELDLIQVVGKTKPVRIFFLFGDESVASTEAFASLAFAHGSMIAAYRGREWAEALAQLEVCRNQAPDILRGFYLLYEERIANLVASPPPPAWDGVFAALTK